MSAFRFIGIHYTQIKYKLKKMIKSRSAIALCMSIKQKLEQVSSLGKETAVMG